MGLAAPGVNPFPRSAFKAIFLPYNTLIIWLFFPHFPEFWGTGIKVERTQRGTAQVSSTPPTPLSDLTTPSLGIGRSGIVIRGKGRVIGAGLE